MLEPSIMTFLSINGNKIPVHFPSKGIFKYTLVLHDYILVSLAREKTLSSYK